MRPIITALFLLALILCCTPVMAAAPDGTTPQTHDADQLVFTFCYDVDGGVKVMVYQYLNGPFYITEDLKIHGETAVFYDDRTRLHVFRFKKRYDVHCFDLKNGGVKIYPAEADKPLPLRP